MISSPRTPPAAKSDRIRALLARSHDDPARFARTILGAPPFDADDPTGNPFWSRQAEAAQLVVRHHTVILPWGNALGKSWWAARLVLWWLCTRRDSLIITTAPTFQQLSSVLWKNIRQAYASSRIPIGGRLRQAPPGLHLGEAWCALGISTTKTERMSGHHANDLLVIVDEASDISAEIIEAIDSLVPSKIVYIGNPIRAEGRFRDDYEQAVAEAKDPSIPDDERKVALRVPSTESPDIHLPRSKRGMASGAWLRQMERKYGENSLWVRTHIRALFPEVSSDTLIPKAWLDWATRPEHRPALLPGDPRGGRRRISCDLGEGVGRDSTAIVVRDDLGILEVVVGNSAGIEEAAAAIARLRLKWAVSEDDITFDRLGLGKKLPNHLLKHGITRAKGYAGSGRPKSPNDFTNLRTEAAWKLHLRLDPNWCPDVRAPGVRQTPFHIPAGPWWARLREELEVLTYDLVGKQMRLLSKQDWCDKLGRSPDLADALIQSFAF